MEDLIILLLFVAWIGYSFYKESQKQKKKLEAKPSPKPLDIPMQPEERSITPQMNDTNIDTDVVIEVPEDEFQPVTHKYSSKKANIEQASSLKYIPLIDQIDRPNFISIEYDSNNVVKFQEKLEQATEEDVSDKYTFDLKQAIIYSAILQRPYD